MPENRLHQRFTQQVGAQRPAFEDGPAVRSCPALADRGRGQMDDHIHTLQSFQGEFTSRGRPHKRGRTVDGPLTTSEGLNRVSLVHQCLDQGLPNHSCGTCHQPRLKFHAYLLVRRTSPDTLTT